MNNFEKKMCEISNFCTSLVGGNIFTHTDKKRMKKKQLQ